MARFEYFVILADMRTGSNYLEASLDLFEEFTCYGEVFNPHFIGQHNKSELFGFDLQKREVDPLGLIAQMKQRSTGLAGFRFFNDHDPRVLSHVLADNRCAKIILSRNPLECYVSLKIAAQTGQWKLRDAKRQRAAEIVFEKSEFVAQLDAKQVFQSDIQKALQTRGQTGFYINYDDLGDVDIINGLGKFLGTTQRIPAPAKTTKKQNPTDLENKVSNHSQMVEDLASIDYFGLSQTPSFEPRRGPGVSGFALAARSPLLFIPITSGPNDAVLNWLAVLDDASVDELQTDLTQKVLRDWKRETPHHRSFTVLRHPLARAHTTFCRYILPLGLERFATPRRILRNRYDVCVPGKDAIEDYTKDQHREAFGKFLLFLTVNLGDQTSIRIDPAWATQSAILQGAAQVALPDYIIREDEAEVQLAALAQRFNLKTPIYAGEAADVPYTLQEIYDAKLEKQAWAAYRKDYISFGFSDWRPL